VREGAREMKAREREGGWEGLVSKPEEQREIAPSMRERDAMREMG
jgi:hypothetical protein